MDLSKRRRVIAATGAILGVILLLWWWLAPRDTTSSSTTSPPEVARVPNADISGRRFPALASPAKDHPAPAPSHILVQLGAEAGVPPEYSFTAGGTRDAEGHEIKEYLWDFGDGTQERTASPGVLHSYADAIYGPTDEQEFHFNPTLTVTDDRGESAKGEIAITIYNRIGYLAKYGRHGIEVLPSALLWEDEPQQWSCRLVAKNPGDVAIQMIEIQVTFSPAAANDPKAELTLPAPKPDVLPPKGSVDAFLKIPDTKVPEAADHASFTLQARADDGKPVVFTWTSPMFTASREAMKHKAPYPY